MIPYSPNKNRQKIDICPLLRQERAVDLTTRSFAKLEENSNRSRPLQPKGRRVGSYKYENPRTRDPLTTPATIYSLHSPGLFVTSVIPCRAESVLNLPRSPSKKKTRRDILGKATQSPLGHYPLISGVPGKGLFQTYMTKDEPKYSLCQESRANIEVEDEEVSGTSLANGSQD